MIQQMAGHGVRAFNRRLIHENMLSSVVDIFKHIDTILFDVQNYI